MQKKLAFAPCAASMSKTIGVIVGCGPSSKLRYNSFWDVGIRQTLLGKSQVTILGISAGMIMPEAF
jgi:hypothetical protein